MDANRRNWDRRLPVHVGSAFYDVDGFREGRSTLHAIETDELGDVSGRTLLHLQCHFGMDTLSWARLGAHVTGVDFSEPAIAQARSLAAEVGLEARFLLSNVYELTRVLHEQFDIVFTSYGVLGWLPDIPGWARVVARFLRPGGRFLLVEFHPIGLCLEEVEGRLVVSCPMFERDAQEYLSADTYADPGVALEPTSTYQWAWTAADVVGGLIDAGLRIERLRELPVSPYQRYPSMVRDSDGWWRLAGDPVPLLLVCRAVKPL